MTLRSLDEDAALRYSRVLSKGISFARRRWVVAGGMRGEYCSEACEKLAPARMTGERINSAQRRLGDGYERKVSEV